MDAAIFGLIGVVLGALLNAVQGWSLARRNEQRERRTAARLLLVELEGLEAALVAALKSPSRAALGGLEMTWWADQGPLLARVLEDEWKSLHSVNESLQLFKHEAEDFDPDEPLWEDDLAHLRLTLDVARHAVTELRQVAGALSPEDVDRKGSKTYGKYLAAAGGPVKLRRRFF